MPSRFVQNALATALDIGMKILGPILVIAALSLLTTVTYIYFAVLAPATMTVFSLTWSFVSAIGLWLMFNVFWNYINCVFTDPVSHI